jgi:probable O-glycosylation ligase (exosortase A-associated)
VAVKTGRVAKASKTDGWPFFVLLAFYVFEYLRPQESYTSFIAPLSLPAILNMVLIFVVLKSPKANLNNQIVKFVFLFYAQIFLFVPFATNNYAAYQVALTLGLTLVSVAATIIVLDSRDKLRIFVNVWIITNTLSAIWIITHGGKGPGGFLIDENDACAMMNTALPFSLYFGLKDKNRRIRLLSAVSIPIFLTAIVMTSSRGGFIGFVAVGALVLFLSKRRWRNIFLAATFAFIAGNVVLAILPDGYVREMQSIENTQDGTANLRLLHWTTGIEVFKENPIFGVGPNNYPWTSFEYFHLSPYFVEGSRNRAGRQAHSLYFTLIPELGLLGIFVFLSFITLFYKNLFKIRTKFKNDSENSDYFGLANALIVGMSGFLISGVFISVLYYPIMWHLLAMAVVLINVALRAGLDQSKATRKKLRTLRKVTSGQ